MDRMLGTWAGRVLLGLAVVVGVAGCETNRTLSSSDESIDQSSCGGMKRVPGLPAGEALLIRDEDDLASVLVEDDPESIRYGEIERHLAEGRAVYLANVETPQFDVCIVEDRVGGHLGVSFFEDAGNIHRRLGSTSAAPASITGFIVTTTEPLIVEYLVLGGATLPVRSVDEIYLPNTTAGR